MGATFRDRIYLFRTNDRTMPVRHLPYSPLVRNYLEHGRRRSDASIVEFITRLRLNYLAKSAEYRGDRRSSDELEVTRAELERVLNTANMPFRHDEVGHLAHKATALYHYSLPVDDHMMEGIGSFYVVEQDFTVDKNKLIIFTHDQFPRSRREGFFPWYSADAYDRAVSQDDNEDDDDDFDDNSNSVINDVDVDELNADIYRRMNSVRNANGDVAQWRQLRNPVRRASTSDEYGNDLPPEYRNETPRSSSLRESARLAEDANVVFTVENDRSGSNRINERNAASRSSMRRSQVNSDGLYSEGGSAIDFPSIDRDRNIEIREEAVRSRHQMIRDFYSNSMHFEQVEDTPSNTTNTSLPESEVVTTSRGTSYRIVHDSDNSTYYEPVDDNFESDNTETQEETRTGETTHVDPANNILVIDEAHQLLTGNSHVNGIIRGLETYYRPDNTIEERILNRISRSGIEDSRRISSNELQEPRPFVAASSTSQTTNDEAKQEDFFNENSGLLLGTRGTGLFNTHAYNANMYTASFIANSRRRDSEITSGMSIMSPSHRPTTNIPIYSVRDHIDNYLHDEEL